MVGYKTIQVALGGLRFWKSFVELMGGWFFSIFTNFPKTADHFTSPYPKIALSW